MVTVHRFGTDAKAYVRAALATSTGMRRSLQDLPLEKGEVFAFLPFDAAPNADLHSIGVQYFNRKDNDREYLDHEIDFVTAFLRTGEDRLGLFQIDPRMHMSQIRSLPTYYYDDAGGSTDMSIEENWLALTRDYATPDNLEVAYSVSLHSPSIGVLASLPMPQLSAGISILGTDTLRAISVGIRFVLVSLHDSSFHLFWTSDSRDIPNIRHVGRSVTQELAEISLSREGTTVHHIPKELSYHGIDVFTIKQWRERQHAASLPSTLDDFYRAHGMCVTCRGKGVVVKAPRMPFESCPTCRGTGKQREGGSLQ